MNKISKSIGISAILTLLLFTGCNEKTTVTDIVADKKVEKPRLLDETKKPKTEENVPAMEEIKQVDISSVARDNAKIAADGKHIVIIFDSPACKYCNKLKQDILDNKDLKEKLTNSYNTYALDASQNKMHSLEHEGDFMNVDTKTLVDIYNVTATPTIIFTDLKAKSILVVPGYMPANQFMATLDFIEKGLWKNKDRKNGEVYQALKDHYIKTSIIKNDKK